jgi:hypothetical protein
MRFESKRDGWIVFITRVMPFILLVVLAVTGYSPGHSMRGVIAGFITLVIVELFLVGPMMRATYYAIEGDTLLVRSGPAKWRVPIREIRSITPTRSALSSPALSLDRLRIEYGKKSVMISPEDKQRFIEALRTINPAIMA